VNFTTRSRTEKLDYRYKLQKRIRRQKTASIEAYTPALKQLIQFIDSEPSLIAVQAELAARFPDAESVAKAIVNDGLLHADQAGLIDSVINDEGKWAAVGMRVLRGFAALGNAHKVLSFVPHLSSSKIIDHVSAFSDWYLTPFYEYLDERLDDPQFVLGRLIRFKHLCEWFWRDELLKLSEESKRGEKRLAERLYEFLYIEGLPIHVEPSSVSGEADMVSSQEGPDRLVADAKIFNPDKNKSKGYILQSFRQIYQYTCDYNSAMGYLVVFNTSDKQLRFAVSGEAKPLPRVVLNHKAIFFVTIDVYPHEESASKRPPQEFVEITEAEILGVTQAAVTT
jgi:hypothetical protein